MELKLQVFIYWLNQVVHVQSIHYRKTMVRRSRPIVLIKIKAWINTLINIYKQFSETRLRINPQISITS